MTNACRDVSVIFAAISLYIPVRERRSGTAAESAGSKKEKPAAAIPGQIRIRNSHPLPRSRLFMARCPMRNGEGSSIKVRKIKPKAFTHMGLLVQTHSGHVAGIIGREDVHVILALAERFDVDGFTGSAGDDVVVVLLPQGIDD